MIYTRHRPSISPRFNREPLISLATGIVALISRPCKATFNHRTRADSPWPFPTPFPVPALSFADGLTQTRKRFPLPVLCPRRIYRFLVYPEPIAYAYTNSFDSFLGEEWPW